MPLSNYLSFAILLWAWSARAQSLTFIHANVVDVATGQIQPNMTVVIAGQRIARVSPFTKTLPRAGRVVDATGQYLMPGLWDMHTHVYL